MMRKSFEICAFGLMAASSTMGSCVDRDWDAPCPEGWSLEGLTCAAPLSYQGSCAYRVGVESIRGRKQDFAEHCEAHWRCRDTTCEEDFGVTCPQGWQDQGDGVCQAPLLYSGSCKPTVRMGDEAWKEEFGMRCNVKWPCKVTCAENLGLKCPTGWIEIDATCVATKTYSGPCVPFATLANLSKNAKRSFADKCQVRFCDIAGKANTKACDLALSSSCPLGWRLIGSRIGYCHAREYQGPCRPLVSLAALESIGKEEYADTCGVKWSCADSERGLPVDHVAADSESSELPRGPIASDGSLLEIL